MKDCFGGKNRGGDQNDIGVQLTKVMEVSKEACIELFGDVGVVRTRINEERVMVAGESFG